MATSTHLHALNNYPEFRTKRDIELVKRYVQGVQDHLKEPLTPRRLTEDERDRWIQKFSRDFAVRDGRLLYEPRNPKTGKARLSLEVVLPEEREEKLSQLYGDLKEGLSTGINGFYYQVASHFLNIPRAVTTAFLKRQTVYQVTRDYQKKPVHPILAVGPNERWMLDNVYMSKYGINDNSRLSVTDRNQHFPPNADFEKPVRVSRHSTRNLNSYIAFMTCIDLFSNKVWIESLLAIDSDNTARALARICARSQTFPKLVQTDNGPEFKDKFDAYIRHHNATHPVNRMTHVLGSANDPQSNAKVERMNRTIRKKLRELFVRTDDVEWVKHVTDVEDSINSNRITGTRFTPNMLWRPGWFGPPDGEYSQHAPTDTSSKQQIIRAHQLNLLSRAADRIENNGGQLEVNDLVRVANAEYDPRFKARLKGGFEHKYSAIQWSPELYRVAKVNAQEKVPLALRKLNQKSYDIGQVFYSLRTYPGNQACRKQYARSQLQKVGTIHSPPVPVPYDIVKREGYLNRFDSA